MLDGLKRQLAEFKRGEELELAYYQSQNIPVEYDWHHMHHLGLLASVYLHEGELEKPEQTLKESIATPSLTVQYGRFQGGLTELPSRRGRSGEALRAVQDMRT